MNIEAYLSWKQIEVRIESIRYRSVCLLGITIFRSNASMDRSSGGLQQNLAIQRGLDAVPNKTISYHFASESFSIVFSKVL